MIFDREINGWKSWGEVFCDLKAFGGLAGEIFRANGLEFSPLERLAPGTNAVFASGSCVIKLFAPKEAYPDGKYARDYLTELSAMRFADSHGVAAPKIYASGTFDDKYSFDYIIMERISGESFGKAVGGMTVGDKIRMGRRLLAMTKRLNVAGFTQLSGGEMFEAAIKCDRWDGFPGKFRLQRLEYLVNLRNKGYKPVFVHGDFNPDNLIIDKNGELRLIDFADARVASIAYEYAGIVCELLRFDPALTIGFRGRYSSEKLRDICLDGLLLHEFGANIIADNIADPSTVTSLSALFARFDAKYSDR